MIARIWRRLRGTRQTPARVAAAVASGMFIGCLPVYGLHFVLCSAVCLPLGLDLVLAYLVANISNPLVAPFLIASEIEVGSLVTAGRHAAFSLPQVRQTGLIGFVWEAAVGSLFIGGALATLGGALAYVLAGRRQTPEPALHSEERLAAARARTLARYASAAIADRCQVAGKLRWDPLTRRLAELPAGLGRVLDAGAGRGQFALLLLELGACEQVLGFDSDARKVAVACGAGRGDARFEVRDLSELPTTPMDTILFFDVLHYLPLAAQDELLAKAAGLAERLLIRELDSSASARSRFTRGAESLAKRFGLHRAQAGHHYRSAAELVLQLSALGFRCNVHAASEGTPFDNVFIVATRG